MHIWKWVSEQFYTLKHGDSLKRQMETLAECFALCNELMEQQDEDIHTIKNALHTCFDDEVAMSNQEDLRHSDIRFFIDAKSEIVSEKNRVQREHILSELLALLVSYPELDEGAITPEGLDIFYLDRITHHQQVMALVEVYLPETYAQLSVQQHQLSLGEMS